MSLERIRHARRLTREFARPIRIETPVHQTSYQMDGKTYDIDIWHRHQYEFPVPKLDDNWIVNEASSEEVNQLIEGWLQGIILSLRDYKRSPLAKKYDIKTPLNKPLERLVAYTELVDEYSLLRDGYLEKNLDGGDPEDIERAEKAQQIQDLIMNKFVIEHYGLDGYDDTQPLRVRDIVDAADHPSVILACNSLLTEASAYAEKVDYTNFLGNSYYQKNSEI